MASPTHSEGSASTSESDATPPPTQPERPATMSESDATPPPTQPERPATMTPARSAVIRTTRELTIYLYNVLVVLQMQLEDDADSVARYANENGQRFEIAMNDPLGARNSGDVARTEWHRCQAILAHYEQFSTRCDDRQTTLPFRKIVEEMCVVAIRDLGLEKVDVAGEELLCLRELREVIAMANGNA